jgi:hypothetical protein
MFNKESITKQSLMESIPGILLILLFFGVMFMVRGC